MILSMATPAFAEGSQNMTDPTDGGYRPYAEWKESGQDSSTAKIPRTQIWYVYAEAGDTVYLGSSVCDNYQDKDIVVYKPNGDLLSNYDVIKGGTGHIDTRAKELAGPKINDTSSDGYEPFHFIAEAAGIYKVEFHSNTDKGQSSNNNPTPAEIEQDSFEVNQKSGYIAAWDITVVNEAGNKITGRIFTNYLALNMGKNITTDMLTASVFVLVDGYIYEVDFDGMDPYGFVFFANNRGLVDATTHLPLYHSIYDKDDVTGLSNVNIHKPGDEANVYDETYPIFLNIPDSALLASLGQSTPQIAGEVKNFYFRGYEDNEGYVGKGGEFHFTTHNASSFKLELRFDESDPNNVRILSNSCVEGENIIQWDGKDAYGEEVPAGTYGGDSGNIKISMQLRSGEVHFPLLDVENNRNGLKVTLLNGPDGGAIPKSMVYYNNGEGSGKEYVPKLNDEKNLIQNGHPENVDKPNRSDQMPNPNAGIESKDGALWFSNGAGDSSLIDLWTYYVSESTATATLSVPFHLIDPAYGGFTVSKTVTGDGADTEKEFSFTASAVDGSNTPISDGTYGDLTFADGEAPFTLKSGDSITVSDLPVGTKYTVTETTYDVEGYSTSVNGSTGREFTGTVADAKDLVQAIRFVNAFTMPTGKLLIEKTVTGIGDTEKEWTFNVTFSNDGSYSYTGSKTGTITSGDSIKLKHGESVTISNIPVDVTYTVTEDEANQDG
ncbi:MAG: DUF5979 domain-containing protein, partial [Oscillospiraceae bacterium]|nr:DUF5979 domain-containing protein [Oscillospiraceae bacterium]